MEVKTVITPDGNHIYHAKHTIWTKVLGRPLLMNRFDYFRQWSRFFYFYLDDLLTEMYYSIHNNVFRGE